MSEPLPVLDRRPYFDERSRNYAVAERISTPVPRRKRVWTVRPSPLDQGAEGACVGFSLAGELACTPRVHAVNDAYAHQIYQAARAKDAEMGNNWDSGASVLAGLKALKARGEIVRYHWAFGIDEVIDALVARGPVVLGIPWYSGMYQTDERGLVTTSGNAVGGHAILANGYWPDHPEFGEDVIVWTNSWGSDYGRGGTGFIRPVDLSRLLSERGEAAVLTDARP